VKGVDIKVIRTGRGDGPTTVSTVRSGSVVATSTSIGFPMASRSTMGDDVVVAACITSAPPGCRWCGIDLDAGTLLIYGPGAEHTAVNPAGVSFSFAATTQEALAERSELLGASISPPPRGQVHVLPPEPRASVLAHSVVGWVEASVAGTRQTHGGDEPLLDAMIGALSTGRRLHRVGAERRLDSRRIANVCIEYAQAAGRMPSISEMCLVAHVSERRLRRAFNEEYETSPASFFRTWGLDRARRVLRSCAPIQGTVTRVALDLGFAHLGRFSVRYKALYGESPSTTLRSTG